MSGHRPWNDLRRELPRSRGWRFRLLWPIRSFVYRRLTFRYQQWRWDRSVAYVESWRYAVCNPGHPASVPDE